MARDDRLWVPLDANFQDDDRLVNVSAEAELLYVRSLGLAKRLASDGRFRVGHLRRLCDKFEQAPDKLAEELIGVGAWRCEGAPGTFEEVFVITSWLRWNSTAADIDEIRAAKQKGARKGNHRRYGHPGPVATCPICNPPSHTDSHTDSHSDRICDSHSESHTDRISSLEIERETEREVERSARAREADASKPKRRRRAPETPLPKDYRGNDDHKRIAREEGRNFARELVRFRDHALANDRRQRDWDATFRNWLRSDYNRPSATERSGAEAATDVDDEGGFRSRLY